MRKKLSFGFAILPSGIKNELGSKKPWRGEGCPTNINYDYKTH
jgi:hypothetical protein